VTQAPAANMAAAADQKLSGLVYVAVFSLPLIAWSRDIAVATLVLGAIAVLSDMRLRTAVGQSLTAGPAVLAGAFGVWSFASLFWAPTFAWDAWAKTVAALLLGICVACALPSLTAAAYNRLVKAVLLAAVLLLILLLFERLTDGLLIGLARQDETVFQRITALAGGLVLLCSSAFAVAVLMSRHFGTYIVIPLWIAAILGVSVAYPMDAEVMAVGGAALAFLIVLFTGRVGMIALLVIFVAGMLSWGFMAEAAAAAGWHHWLMTQDPNWGYRVEIWRYVSELSREHFIQGHGFDSARALGRNATLLPSFEGKTSFLHPHNGMLQIWLELGLVGVLLVVGTFAAAIGAFLKRKPSRLAQATVTATIIATGIMWSLSFGVWQGWWLAVLGLIACAVVLACRPAPARTRKRLVFLVTEYYFFHALKKELTQGALAQGFEIIVAARCGSDSPTPDDPNITVIPFDWKRSSSLVVSLIYFLPDLFRVWRLMQRLDPDILHNIALKPSIVGALAVMGRDTQVISAIHGFGFVFFNRSLGARAIQAGIGMILKISSLTNATIFLLINRDDVALMQRIGVAPAQLRMMRGTGIDLQRFAPMPEPAPPFTFLVIGRLLYMKGVDVLMDAHRLLQERGLVADLVVCGAPDPDNPSSIPPAVLDEWRTRAHVTFTGQVPDVRPLIAACHVLILPSRGGEGLPRALTEAAACGRPLIATAIPGSTEVALPDETGIVVPPGDPVALADAMQWMIQHPAERRRFGQAARALIEREFSSAHVAASHAALYSVP